MGIQGLEFQTIDVKFDKGLETKTQKKLVVPGKWLILKNVTLSVDYTPQKRDGIAALVATANGNGLATFNNELLIVNGYTVSSVSTGGNPTVAVARTGELGYVGVAKTEVQRANGTLDSLDCATGVGYTCYVWRDANPSASFFGIRCTLIDEATGTQLVSNFRLASGGIETSPRVVYAGNAFYIFYLDPQAARVLYCHVIATAAPTVVGNRVALVTDSKLGTNNIDACAFGSAFTVNTAMVVYGWNDNIDTVRSIQVTRTGTVPSVFATNTSLILNGNILSNGSDTSALCCVALTGNLAAVFAMGSGLNQIWGASIDGTWATVTTATQIGSPTSGGGACHLTAVVLASGNVQIFFDRQALYGTNGLTPISTVVLNTSIVTQSTANIINAATFGTAGTDAAGPNGPFIYGKAFVSGTGVFLPVCTIENYSALPATRSSNNQQNSFFILDAANSVATAPVVVGKALYGTFGVAGIIATYPVVSTPCSVATISSGVFGLAATEFTALTLVGGTRDANGNVTGGTNLSSTGVVRLTMTPQTTKAPIKAQLGESTYFAGGSLTDYDGAGLAEHGFSLFPEGLEIVAVAGGSLTALAAYQVIAIYEWVDNSGQRHQSAPSLPISATIAAGGATATLRVKVPTLLISQKTGVNIIIYVTLGNGTTFYRWATVAAGANGTPNDMTVAYITAPDILAETNFAGNEILYTQPDQAGTTLPNNSPGPCSVLGVHQNRLWLDRTDQPGAFTYSQEYINNLGLQFNETLGGMIDSAAGGSIQGFCSMDEKQIIFATRKIYVVYGSGPNSSGGFSTYGSPQEIPSDVGCIEPRSILRMPHGIIFKSAKGWYLLGRDLSVRYIGGAVALYDANSVTASALLSTTHECRFHAIETPTLIYSYLTDEWSTASYAGATSPYGIRDALWWATGNYYVHTSLSDGTNKDTPGVYVDSPGAQGPASIPIQMQTSFLHLGILEGFQRVRWMYLTATAGATPLGSLTITVDYDDATTGTAPGAYNFSFTLASLGVTTGLPLDIRHKLRRQKCKSVSFTIAETPVAGGSSSQIIGFQALSLQVGSKRGTNKLKGTQGVG